MENQNWILIVDDDEMTLQMLNEFLEALTDLSVKRAACVDDAWKIINSAQQPPLLVISDLCMPGKYGLELFNLCRQKLPTTHFYLMSGLTSVNQTIFNQAKNLLNSSFIEKPLNLEKIQKVIQFHQLAKGS